MSTVKTARSPGRRQDENPVDALRQEVRASGGLSLSEIDKRVKEIEGLEAEVLNGSDASTKTARNLGELRAERDLLLIRRDQAVKNAEAEAKAARLKRAEDTITEMVDRCDSLKREAPQQLKKAQKHLRAFVTAASEILTAPYQSHAAQAIVLAEAEKFGLDAPSIEVVPTVSKELQEILGVHHQLSAIFNEGSADYLRSTMLRRLEADEYEVLLEEALSFVRRAPNAL